LRGHASPVPPRLPLPASPPCCCCSRQGVSVRVARIFNTYGPKMDPDDGRVVSNFIKQALR